MRRFTHKTKVTSCGYIILKKQKLITNFQSVYEASNIVKANAGYYQLEGENFRLQEKNGIQNAYATIMNNQRWIVYDNNFLEDIDAYTKTKWSSISIMAHEMGHQYYNHVVSSTVVPSQKKTEADFFNWYLMAKMGATKEQSIAAISTIASDRASSTHPGKADRINAISQGWDKAGVSNTTTKTLPLLQHNLLRCTGACSPLSLPQGSQPAPTIPGGTQQTDPANDPQLDSLIRTK